MVIFSNVGKLFSYNWGSLLSNVVPRGNKALIDSKSVTDITQGSITRIIGVIVTQIAGIGLAVYIYVKALSYFAGSEISWAIVSEVIRRNTGDWVRDIIITAIVPIAALIYVQVMKRKEQSGWPYFIFGILALLTTFYSIFGLLGWLAGIVISPLFAILGVVSIGLAFLGNASVAVGCMDFCQKLSASAPVLQNMQQPMQGAQSMIPGQQPMNQPYGNLMQPMQPMAPQYNSMQPSPAAAPVVNQQYAQPAQQYTPVQPAPVADQPMMQPPVAPPPVNQGNTPPQRPQ